jgi:two-component system, OmpR family, response regulator
MVCIAVVEDEGSLRADLVEYLGASGHCVVGCVDGRALEGALTEHPIEIVILDVNLPGESGFTIAGRLREHSGIGIVMLTARNLAVDRVVGLELGADVYLVKPVELRELEAQVRALARRLATPPAVAPADTSPAGSWVYDLLAWTLVAPDGAVIKLTGSERIFLSLLAVCPGEAVSRTDIFTALGKRSWDPADRSVDSLVRRLRAKGEEVTGVPVPIEAVHGVGYAFAAPLMTR